MRRVSCFLFFLLIIFSLPACLAQNIKATPQEGKGMVDPYSWDFGQAKQGVVLNHSFIFKNQTQKTINIKDVNTSCGCAVSEIKKRILLPEEETMINVRFNTQGYSGSVQQFIYVHTDNPGEPVVRFIIKADVIKGLPLIKEGK